MNSDIDDPLREQMEHAIRIIPDFPVAGMRFRDITPILEEDPALYCAIIDRITHHYQSNPPDCVVCIESFGYVFGAPLAYRLAVRLVLARRQGKLPRETIRKEYQMCYASDKSLEIHRTSIRPGDRVVIVDDVMASGGSALAAVQLVERAGGLCVGVACVADMPDGPFRLEIEKRGISIFALARL
jgi:adenine phosphoribosyltransferase